MNTYRFILRLKHDRGWVTIHTAASSADAARRQVMAAERCPERAIREVRCVDNTGYELVLQDPSQRVILQPPATSTRITPLPPERYKGENGKANPTAYMVRTIDQRWRRVYQDCSNHAYLLYVTHGPVKTLVRLAHHI